MRADKVLAALVLFISSLFDAYENKMKDKTDLQSKNHLYLKKDNTDDTLLLPLF